MSGLLKRRFCIVGLGLLGGTYAMCLKRLDCRVTAVDIDEKAICWAKEHGVIDEGTAGAPEALRLQPEEVQAVRWAEAGQVLRLLDEGRFVPYHASFIRLLFDTREHGGGLDRHGRELTKE